MKRFLLLLNFLLIGIVQTFAYDFEVDDICYNILSGTTNVEVTSNDNQDDSYPGSVSIPSSVSYGGTTYSVTSIGSSAFSYCSGLTSVIIPSSVTSIGSSAFFYCRNLTSIVIPSSVTSIGSSAFGGCSGLASISVDAANTVYDSRNNCNAIIKKSNNQLVAGCKNTDIPSSVTSIGDYAFGGCPGLTSVVIPSSVTSIGSSAFWGCSGLTSVVIPSSVTSIGNSAFSYCSGLTSVVIPSSVTSIGDSAFEGCSGLTSVIIPSSVTSIAYKAFCDCYSLTSIEIPSSVTSIGNAAFYGCSGLTSVVIPSSVTSIGHYAFDYCSGLTSVIIPSSVTSIGSYAFSNCSGLTSISVNSGNTVYDSRNNCNAIIKKSNNELIAGCKNTVIPSSVTCIGDEAFRGCSGLTSVVIPSSVTRIDWHAFSNCSGITSVVIPSSVTSIGYGAFDYCSGLTSVTMLCPPPSFQSAGISSAATIYVTRDNYDAYTALGLSNRIEILNDKDAYDNILYLDEQELQAGSDATLSLKLKNNVDITSLQFDLVLPEGITIPNGSNGKPNIEVSTSRTTTSKHKVYSNPQDDGSLRVICASLGNYAFSETDGEVLQIHIRVAADATAGVHDIIFKNIELTQPDNTQHEVEQVQYSVTVTERARQKGDVNNDGLINAVDVDLAGQILLQKLSYDSYADMDDNGTVTIGDVTEIIRVASAKGHE